MEISKDFKEFIKLLNDHEVKYLLVGGYALAFYSRPKFTNDMDIWIEAREENAKKMLKVLTEFGFGDLELIVEDLTSPNKVIQIGYPPLRIDIITSVTGVQFESAYENKIIGSYFDEDVDIISVQDLISNKEAIGRDKDKQDLKWLNQYRKTD